MKTAKDYPVTYGYGYHEDYPINNGFHRGEDRAMPVGVPVVVNKTKIGSSGKSGYVTGPHLHIGRYKFTRSGVQYINPRGKGFKLRSVGSRHPRVVYTGYNSSNGNFVRIENWQGHVFVYCHLTKITCKAGDRVK